MKQCRLFACRSRSTMQAKSVSIRQIRWRDFPAGNVRSECARLSAQCLEERLRLAGRPFICMKKKKELFQSENKHFF